MKLGSVISEVGNVGLILGRTRFFFFVVSAKSI